MQAGWGALIREASKQRCIIEATSVPALHKVLKLLAESSDVATMKLFRQEERRRALQGTCVLTGAAALQSALMAAGRRSRHGSWEVSARLLGAPA